MHEEKHHCDAAETFPTDKFLQIGRGRGSRVLIVGESLAGDGWRKWGRAFYTCHGHLSRSGRNLNKLLQRLDLTVEECCYTDLVKCYTKRSRLRSCGEKCWPIFERQFKADLLIITLGVETLKTFSHLLGEQFTMGDLSRATLIGRTYPLLPIRHPSSANPKQSENAAIFERHHIGLRAMIG